ncbi:hypothetical protein [Desulfobacter postgatei]|uniref:hypothetical protein n=1 Tax=Desulfobacter postgatei TaxID=2293 RepID=UPI00259B62A3|nr:hypothetical protein [uncultured Desulfobacter sp.]
MLGPILQSLWQTIGPAAQQLFQAAAPYAKRIPPHVYVRAATEMSKSVSSWYNSLNIETQERIDNAIAWVVKDLSGDIATAVTGLPIGPLVEKVLDIVWEFKDTPDAKAYINDELSRQIEQKKIS